MTAADRDERLAAAFGRQVARWAREQGASASATILVQRAAALASQATTDGHSCLGLDELRDVLSADAGTALDAAALRTLLVESKVVGSPAAPGSLPLILDDERLYLHRYFEYECRLARSLASRSADRSGAIAMNGPAPAVVALLDRLFGANAGSGEPDWQKRAATTALLGRLTIISGGPGTGKTTTVVNLLACLLEADPGCRIALTAPTGKAAARMTEVVLQRAGHLPAALRAKLPTGSSTIHRLLGSAPHGGFRHHSTNALPIDVLVVDEASMLDLALAVHLMEAVPAGARIILLGDKDQLAAVESGAVFSELSNHTRLDDSVIRLRRNYRFNAGSAIGLLAGETNEGHSARALERLENPTDPSLVWIKDGGSVPSPKSVHAILEGYSPYVDVVRSSGAESPAITTAFARFRVLCAVRDGPWGVNTLNQRISTHVRRILQHPLDPGFRSDWYPGRPVMVLRNDSVLKLFNGDIGVVWPDAAGVLRVWFSDDTGGFRAISPVRLPEHETAFAMTVHKAQGSEFDEVLLVLPAEQNRVLTRELFYTAVTRARERLTLVANATVIASTIESPTKRVSGLLARLNSYLD